MKAIIDAAIGASASYNLQFLAYLLMGLLVGWVLTQPRKWGPAFTSLALVGVCGAWLGAEFAHLFGQAERGGSGQFSAAIIGSVAFAYTWRRLHRSRRGPDVAMGPPQA